MKLHQLYPNFSHMTDDAQLHHVRQYRATRNSDFVQHMESYDLRKAASKRPAAITLTDEEKILIKKLGISRAQLIALKSQEA